MPDVDTVESVSCCELFCLDTVGEGNSKLEPLAGAGDDELADSASIIEFEFMRARSACAQGFLLPKSDLHNQRDGSVEMREYL